jgi:3-isopropylmalate/(R)-2-methylmalate dehydratase small subunit
VSADFLKVLLSEIKEKPKTEIVVNLENQTILIEGTSFKESFDIDAYKKTCMINGFDDIDYLLSKKETIEAFEKQKTY